MIVPIIAIGLLALLAGGAMGAAASSGSQETWKRSIALKFAKTTLVSTGTDGLYNVQVVPNTTPAMTHIANAVYQQGQTVFATQYGDLVYFSSDGSPPKVGKWFLFARPGLIHR